MGTNFSQVFGNIRTPDDYRRAKEEFELNKRLKQAQIEQAQMKAQNPSSSLPATLQVNAAIESALSKGDYDTANRIAWLQRSQAYGVDTFGPQGNSPETFQPFKPKVGASTQPSQPPQAPAPTQQEYVPTGQSIMPRGGSSIAQQLAANAALKKGAEEAAKISAEKRTEAGIDLPKSIAQAQEASKLINSIRNHPGLSAVVGMPNPLEGRIPLIGNVPGSKAADFQAKLDQMGGKNFLEAFQSLKGGGQITEVEGEKATNAIARMQTSQSEVAFLEALADLEDVVNTGLERAYIKAGQRPPQKSGARQEMEVMQGKFKKNDINQLLDIYAPK